MHHPTDRITHTTAFVTPVVEHWLERKIYSMEPDTSRWYGFVLLMFVSTASLVVVFKNGVEHRAMA